MGIKGWRKCHGGRISVLQRAATDMGYSSLIRALSEPNHSISGGRFSTFLYEFQLNMLFSYDPHRTNSKSTNFREC